MTDFLRRFGVSLSAAAFFAAAVVTSASHAADTPKDKPAAKTPEKKKAGGKYAQMDYGPFLTASFISDGRSKFDNGPGSYSGDSTARGVGIKLTDDWETGIVFDADLMRVSHGWTHGGLQIHGLIGDGGHGWSPHATVPPFFQTPHLPGWADKSGSFKDPRTNTIEPLPAAGPLPRDYAHYNGLYRHGDRTVLSYTINGAPVLESFGVEKSDDVKAVVRTIRIEKSDVPQAVMIADVNPQYPFPGAKKIDNIEKKPDGYKTTSKIDGSTAHLDDLHAAIVGGEGIKLEVVDGSQLVARIPATSKPLGFKILIAPGGEKSAAAFAEIAKKSEAPADLAALTKGGPSLWKETVETKGVVSKETKEAYVVDNLTLPETNPYGAWMRIGAFDFFPGGTSAALSTWSGDVWIVSGIDDSLEHLKWKRFATGLHQPLGLKIVDGKVYTVGHDQITRLNDIDGDGEADFYENFNSDWELTTAFHAFCFDLVTDRAGNFYFAFGSPVHAGGGGFQKITAHHGSILKISKDGQKLERYATGFRAPNGIGINPWTDQITSGDNEGTWVPKCPIHWVKPGSFNGVVDSAHKEMKSTNGKPDPTEQPKPLCWMPKNIDNSGGGQVWVSSDKWGPFKGDLLHMSYGTSSLYKVLYEEVNGQVQGGVVKLPVKFTSSAMRAHFSERDGQLYVSGLKGWQSNAGKDGGFDRVRYTGAPVYLPTKLNATEKGVSLTFTEPLDPKSANDAGNYSAEIWNYNWTGAYGSGDVAPSGAKADKGKKGGAHDELKVKSAKLQADGKTVFLEIEGIQPVMQMKLTWNIDAKDKPGIKGEIHNTIHNLAPAPLAEAK